MLGQAQQSVRELQRSGAVADCQCIAAQLALVRQPAVEQSGHRMKPQRSQGEALQQVPSVVVALHVGQFV